MKPMQLISSILTVGLVVGAPTIVLAHVGHGDEFQSEGGIERVPVKAETDQMLGFGEVIDQTPSPVRAAAPTG